MNELTKLGNIQYEKHPGSILLRWTYDLRPFYVKLRCCLPVTERGTLIPCPRSVIGVLKDHAFCARHETSSSTTMLFSNPDMAKLYNLLRCSIPDHVAEDCPNRVLGVYKDIAFCKAHSHKAFERRASYPFQQTLDG